MDSLVETQTTFVKCGHTVQIGRLSEGLVKNKDGIYRVYEMVLKCPDCCEWEEIPGVGWSKTK